MQCEEEEAAVAEKGVFFVGGPGAYVIEGKSGAGKNVLLEHFMTRSTIPFENIVTLSTTQEETGSLDFIEQYYDVNRWAIAKKIDEIMYLIDVRKKCLAKIKKELGKEASEAYALNHPMVFIADDIGGTTNLRTSDKNPWYTLFTTVRHLGIYLVMLVQYHKQLGPSFIANARALMTFDYADDAIKTFASCAGVSLTKQDKEYLQKFLKSRFNFLIWWKNWSSTSDIPDLPWTCGKIDLTTRSFTINERQYSFNNKKPCMVARYYESDDYEEEDEEFDELSDSD